MPPSTTPLRSGTSTASSGSPTTSCPDVLLRPLVGVVPQIGFVLPLHLRAGRVSSMCPYFAHTVEDKLRAILGFAPFNKVMYG